MLDLPRMHRIRLSKRPLAQRLIAVGILGPNYGFLPGVRITLEGAEKIPDTPVIYAMNHTDRYNYWPFQFRLWRQLGRFTATWVKGKYYEHPAMARFMELTNNIPTVSRGYLITRDFMATVGRRPSDEEYGALRSWVDATATADERIPAPDEAPAALLETPRDVLGRRFDPSAESYAECVNALFTAFMTRFLELHHSAFDLGLDLLVFPQGTRSVRLSRGRIGLAEVALKFGKTVVPIGCNGSDQVYPGSSPFARSGRIVYRVGDPLTPADMAEFAIDEPFEPFDAHDEARHRERFQGFVDVVMDRINDLLDPPYRYGDEQNSEGVKGSSRFV